VETVYGLSMDIHRDGEPPLFPLMCGNVDRSQHIFRRDSYLLGGWRALQNVRLLSELIFTPCTHTIAGPVKVHDTGPIAEYDARVHSGRLRDDEHQRSKLCNV
jgi:hypothetical protein